MGHWSLTEKKSQEAEKTTFLEFFFAVAHLLIKTKLFCSYQNLISSTVQRFHEGQEKRYNNEQQRTNTTDEQNTLIISASS